MIDFLNSFREVFLFFEYFVEILCGKKLLPGAIRQSCAYRKILKILLVFLFKVVGFEIVLTDTA